MDLHFFNASDYEKVPDLASSGRGLHLSLLAMVGQTGKLTDDFRLVITGPAEVQIDFQGDDFFPHAALHPYKFTVNLEPEELVIPVNQVASPWFNLREMVASGMVTAIANSQAEGRNFLEDWGKHQKDPNPPGAAVRWLVAIERDNSMALHLQGLPLTAEALESRPAMSRDDAPAKLLAKVPLGVDRIRCLSQESIKPLLYAVDTNKAAAAIKQDLEGFIRQLCRLWQRFIVPECLEGEEIDRVAAHPRAGRVSRPYGAAKSAPSQPGPSAPPAQQDLAGNWLPATLYRSLSTSLAQNVRNKIIASVTPQTWNRYLTAWRAFEGFCAEIGQTPRLPVTGPLILDFSSWLDGRHLSAPTIKSYIGSISQLQQLIGAPAISISKQPLLKRFLRGAENAPPVPKVARRARRAVSLPLLQVLGHHLAMSKFSQEERLLFWSAALIAFFGSLRLGELLADRVRRPRTEGLLWSDVSWVDGEIFLRIRSHKSGHEGGDLVILFPYKEKTLCPVKNFNSWASRCSREGAVFARQNGDLWTKQHFNQILQALMVETGLLEENETVSGHSFRAGIPSALGALGTADGRVALSEWGRWQSAAYAAYTRQHVEAKRAIFRKIESILTCYRPLDHASGETQRGHGGR